MVKSKSIIVETEYVYDFLVNNKHRIEKEIIEQLNLGSDVKVVLLHKNKPSDFKIVIWTEEYNLHNHETKEKISKIIQSCLGDRILSICWCSE